MYFVANPECRDYIHPMDTANEKFRFLRNQCQFGNDIDSEIKELLNPICNLRPTSMHYAKCLYVNLKEELEHFFYL